MTAFHLRLPAAPIARPADPPLYQALVAEFAARRDTDNPTPPPARPAPAKRTTRGGGQR